MLFGHNFFDKTKDEHLRGIAKVAKETDTLIFIDTNILAYLYKLHKAARSEFFAWTNSVQNRLKIPAWSANEYLHRVTAKDLHSYTPKSKDPDQPKKALEAMLDTASLFVDEAVLKSIGYAKNRQNFLEEFRCSIDGLQQFTRVFKHQFDPENVHQEIVQHLSGAILNSDIAAFCARAAKDGHVRFEHRIPPAFCDKSKDENKYGDLIIWLEILDYSKASHEEYKKVLFITNDEKTDWVYVPQRRAEIDKGLRKPIPNSHPAIKLIDPRLVAEFANIVGHQNIAICNLSSLIEGLSKDSDIEISQLAAAIQIDLGAHEIEDEVAIPVIAENECDLVIVDQEVPNIVSINNEEKVISTGVAASTANAEIIIKLNYSDEALQDENYSTDNPNQINEIIQSLRSHNWYVQNPAIDKIKSLKEEVFSVDSLFVLGRNIYQSASGNSQKAMEFISNLEYQLSQFTDENAKHILAGILFEIYFDSSGKFRNNLKTRFIDKPLQLVNEECYINVLSFIKFHLQPYADKLVQMPGDINRIPLEITTGPPITPDEFDFYEKYPLLSVMFKGVELLVDKESDEVSYWFMSNELNINDIVQTISRTLAIPRINIELHSNPLRDNQDALVIPVGKTLKAKAIFAE